MSESLSNYFNYFTEIEEHFQKARGTSLFLLSPLDWALIETWKNSGIPLEAVLRGIDGAFEKWRSRRARAQLVNSIAYCAQAVMAEAQRLANIIAQKAREEALAMARLLVSKQDHELLGATEFEIRERVHKLGAHAIETALQERKKGGTKDRA